MERVSPHSIAPVDDDFPDVGSGPARRAPTVGEAAQRNWVLVLVAVLAFGALGAWAGHERDPIYTSSAAVSVGRLDLSVQSVPGFAVGGAVVASGYSRAVTTAPVVNPAARRLGLSPDEVRAHVTASPVPNSPLFLIIATGDSAQSTIALANAVSASMIKYGSGSGTRRATARALSRYRSVRRELASVRGRLLRLRDAPVPDRTAILRLQADMDTLELRAQSISTEYSELEAKRQAGAVLEQLAPARGAVSDRNSKMQLYGAVGALAGLMVGLALAVLRTAWKHRRGRL